jgi:hypothetical protein
MRKTFLLTFLLSLLISNSYVSAKKIPATGQINDKAQKVYVGMYVMNIFDIDMAANSYYADFYIWCRWKGEIDPFTQMEFVNFVEKWGFSRTMVYDSTRVLSDGSNYNIMRAEGRFYHAFSLQKFPLDRQSLDIQIENSEFTVDQLVYLPDTTQSGIRPEFYLPGWDITGFKIKRYVNNYDTNFGLPETEKENYSNLTCEVHLERPMNFFLWKLLLPLIVVVLSSLGSMMIFPGFIDARISMPISALLAAVFLQQSYTANLPDVGYMVLMDKVYVLSYILIIANLVQSIVTANWACHEDEESYAKVKRFDPKYAFISVVLFFIITAVIIVTS